MCRFSSFFNNKIFRYSFIFFIAIGFCFLLPSDTHALSLVNPKIRIYGRQNVTSTQMVTLAECEACSNIKVEGIVENIAVYIPKNLISSFYSYNLTFSFNWKTETGVDIWFDRPGLIYKGSEVSDVSYNTWVNTFNSIEGGYKVKENWFSASFSAPYINLIDQGEFWILMPVNTGTMPENLVGGKLPYYLDFTVWSIGLETTSSGSGPSDEGVIIDNAKNDIINNQNENFIKDQFAQQERFDELTSDNVSSGISKFDEFFNNFQFKDNGGISSIVTMPIELVRNIVTENTCNNLDIDILGTRVSFPNGCSFWSRVPNDRLILYRMLICGLFSYIVLTNFFHDIHILKDPHNLGVDTLDL